MSGSLPLTCLSLHWRTNPNPLILNFPIATIPLRDVTKFDPQLTWRSSITTQPVPRLGHVRTRAAYYFTAFSSPSCLVAQTTAFLWTALCFHRQPWRKLRPVHRHRILIFPGRRVFLSEKSSIVSLPARLPNNIASYHPRVNSSSLDWDLSHLLHDGHGGQYAAHGRGPDDAATANAKTDPQPASANSLPELGSTHAAFHWNMLAVKRCHLGSHGEDHESVCTCSFALKTGLLFLKPADHHRITNISLAMQGGDYMKGAEWGCNFEREAFHKSPTKVCYTYRFFIGIKVSRC